jgi:hypothetical protein
MTTPPVDPPTDPDVPSDADVMAAQALVQQAYEQRAEDPPPTQADLAEEAGVPLAGDADKAGGRG